MKTYFFSLWIVVLLLFQSASVKADSYTNHHKETVFYTEVLEAAKTKQGREIINFFHEQLKENPQRADAISIWLRDNSFRQNDISRINALYFLSYADVLFFMAPGYKQAGQAESYNGLLATAMIALYAYEYLATADSLRCADASVLGAMRQNTLVSRVDDPVVKEAYTILSEQNFDQFVNIAIQFDKKLAKRPPNREICSMGAAKMADLLKRPDIQIKKIDAPGYVGGGGVTEVIAPEGYQYQPEYLSDDAWNKRRDGLEEIFTKNWRSRYVKLSGKGVSE